MFLEVGRLDSVEDAGASLTVCGSCEPQGPWDQREQGTASAATARSQSSAFCVSCS